jgi:hypothetical protein
MLLMLWSPFKDERRKILLAIIEIGLNHEEQHQELLAYDIKYILGNQPISFCMKIVLKPKLKLKQQLYQN